MNTFKKKSIEVKGREICTFDWKYVESKRKDVLNKAIEKANLEPEFLSFAIIEEEREVGWLSAIKDGRDYFNKELNRTAISLDELEKLFEKY